MKVILSEDEIESLISLLVEFTPGNPIDRAIYLIKRKTRDDYSYWSNIAESLLTQRKYANEIEEVAGNQDPYDSYLAGLPERQNQSITTGSQSETDSEVGSGLYVSGEGQSNPATTDGIVESELPKPDGEPICTVKRVEPKPVRQPRAKRN